MKFSPSELYQESRLAKSESFDEAWGDLFFHNTSPKNIFHLLFKSQKSDSIAKKFDIFIDLLSQGADLNKELMENKDLEAELIDFFELESDDEEFQYIENKLLLKLKAFKNQLENLPDLEKSPDKKDLYLESIDYLQKITSFYEGQIRSSELDLSSVVKFFPKITREDFFSKKQPEKIENILNYMGFLNYLRDSKFIDFLYEKSEKIKEDLGVMSVKEMMLYNSINTLIKSLPKEFYLYENRGIHCEKMMKSSTEYSSVFYHEKEESFTLLKTMTSVINKAKARFEAENEERIKKQERLRIKKEAEAKVQKELRKKNEKKEEENARKKEEEKAKKEAIKKEAEEKARKEAEEKTQKEAEARAKKEAEARAKKEDKERRKQAFLEAEKLRQELEEKTKLEAEKLQKELAENAKHEAEAQAKQQEIEKQIKQQQIEAIKDRILEKTSVNFEKFQSFFEFLREKSWLDIGAIGLFGSRIYKEVIHETYPSLKIPENPQADFDFFCIPEKEKSRGIFGFCHEESASRENFREIIEEFNKKNPDLQISFLEDEDGKKSVNFNGLKKSLNFKLVATFLEDEVGEEKTEKTVKEKVEFDLNFYTQQSMLENLQWQFNLERVMLSQISDRSFQLKINQSNCDPSQEKMTIEKFISEAQNFEKQDFLFEANPQARGFLNRIINKKGVYKYLDEATLEAVKVDLLTNTEIKENLKTELLNYKNLADRVVSEPRNSSEIQEKIEQAKLILEKVKTDKIFKEDKDFQEILQRSPKTTPTQASVGQKSKERF